MKWDTIQLGEVMDVKHGYAFKSQNYSDAGELILLTPGNCHETGGLKLKGDKEKYYIGEFPPEFLLNDGDILVVMTDLINTAPILGGSFIIPENNRFLHNQRLGLIQIIDNKRIDNTFLYHLLNTYDYRAQVRGSASGATVRHTSPGRIKECNVRVPRETTYQHKIGCILSTYDDLIENNRRRMAILEDAVRQLYYEWFIRLSFPGHEHTRIVDGVPKGWERVPVPDAIAINPQTKLSDEDEHWWVEMADLDTNSMVIQNAIKKNGRSGSKFKNGDTLFARITPCLENGKTAFVNFMMENEVGRGSTEFIVLRSIKLTPEFVYCLARTYDFRENAIKSMIGASGRQRVQESCFDKHLLLVPPRSILVLFSEFVEPIFEQIKNLHSQNQKLRVARDLLLPRLMTGEIVV
jgi:type I restriction enzyme S subunit